MTRWPDCNTMPTLKEIDDYSPRCKDERCEVKHSCPLYTDRNNPNARIKADTLRLNWESHQIPCKFHQQYFGVLVDDR